MTPSERHPEYWRRVEEILAAVVDRPTEEVDAAIEELAGGDAEVAGEVRSLLGHLPDPENASANRDGSNGGN